jgi:hypothetical protein
MATPAITTWSPDAPTLAALQAWRADADAIRPDSASQGCMDARSYSPLHRARNA